MVEISQDLIDMVNQPTRIGTLSTADKKGVPNVAYFGTPRLTKDKQMIMALRNNRSLNNLQENPHAVFFFAAGAPVSRNTPGYRIYLKVKAIQKQGPILDNFKKTISERAGSQAAESMVAAVIFDVTDIRPLAE
jgi:hypothetical protein